MKDVETPLLDVRDLSVSFGSLGKFLHAVNRACLQVGRGEIVGLIGQSGSGKTTLVMTLLGLVRTAPGVWRGKATLDGHAILPPCESYTQLEQGEFKGKKQAAFLSAQKRLLKDKLGRDVAVIFQEPRAALDPFFRIGEHMLEALRRGGSKGSKSELTLAALELLKDVGLVDAENLLTLYPHEISGGMAQRVMIAMALSAKPKLLIADEPSTALDVTTQAKLLDVFKRLRDKHGLSILLISHDIGVIQEVCNRVYVMHRGAVVECGTVSDVLRHFRHPYTGSLVEAFVRFGHQQSQPPRAPESDPGCAYRMMCGAYAHFTGEQKNCCDAQKPALQGSVVDVNAARDWARCHFPETTKSIRETPSVDEDLNLEETHHGAPPLVKIRSVRKQFQQGRKTFWGLDDVSLTMQDGHTYALVGESGSGKSTLGLSLMVLQGTDSGEILYRDEDLLKTGKSRMQALRREVRMLFQHPEAVLNGGMTVQAILTEALEREKGLSTVEKQRRIDEVLEQVRLEPTHAKRFPANLSSGEKQRVTIARALITRPHLLVCDEPVASLDLAIQSQIMALLKEFQHDLKLTYLFISHNLELVKLLAHTIGVMYMGKLVEEAPAEDFTVERVRHPYTRLLLASVPSMGNEHLRKVCAEYPDVEPERLAGGCPFRNRCPLYLKSKHAACETQMPALKTLTGGAKVACHLWSDN